MSKLPHGWVCAPVSALGELRLGKMLDKSKNKGQPAQYLRNVNVRWFEFDLSDLQDIRVDGAERATLSVRDGDLMICEGGEPGRCAVWRSGPNRLVYQKALHRFRSNGSVEPRFLMYQLKHLAGSGDLQEFFTGTTIKHLTRESLSKLEVAVPPLAEQKRIADKLDRLLAAVGTSKARLDVIPAILKRFRQSVLAAATSGELTAEWRAQNPHLTDSQSLLSKLLDAHRSRGGHKVGNAAEPTEGVHDLSRDMFPFGWSIVELRDLVEPGRPITYGILKPGPELDDGVPYVRVADFPGEQLNLATVRKTSAQIDADFKRSRLSPGDLLISIRGTVGRVIVIPDELRGANITQDSARLSIQPIMNRDYVLYYLRSEDVQRRLRKATKGVAVRGINIGDLRALQIPLPSFEEQCEIARRVQLLFSHADELSRAFREAYQRCYSLPSSLLRKAFRGELVDKANHRDQIAKPRTRYCNAE